MCSHTQTYVQRRSKSAHSARLRTLCPNVRPRAPLIGAARHCHPRSFGPYHLAGGGVESRSARVGASEARSITNCGKPRMTIHVNLTSTTVTAANVASMFLDRVQTSAD